MSDQGFSHIGLSTLDLDRSRDFYENVLGFKAVRCDVLRVKEGGQIRHIFFDTGRGQLIAFMEARGVWTTGDREGPPPGCGSRLGAANSIRGGPRPSPASAPFRSPKEGAITETVTAHGRHQMKTEPSGRFEEVDVLWGAAGEPPPRSSHQPRPPEAQRRLEFDEGRCSRQRIEHVPPQPRATPH